MRRSEPQWPWVRCDACQKIVRHKWFIGGLHICLTPEERAEIERRTGRKFYDA